VAPTSSCTRVEKMKIKTKVKAGAVIKGTCGEDGGEKG
jgi:hypothetical protein